MERRRNRITGMVMLGSLMVQAACTMDLETGESYVDSDAEVEEGDDAELGSIEQAATVDPYAQCSQILAQGVYNRYERTQDNFTAGVITDWACSEESKDRGGNLDLDVDFLGMVDLGLGIGGHSDWQSKNCSSQQRPYRSSSWTYHALDLIADQGIVEAWKSCVSAQNRGFICLPSKRSADSRTFSFDIEWRPGQGQPRTLQLSWNTRSNVDTLSSLPTRISEGTGGADFRIRDLNTTAIVRVQGSDSTSGREFQQTCHMLLDPPPPPVKPVKYVQIRSVKSGKCAELDSNNGATHRNGDNIRQWECMSHVKHQQWKLLPTGQIQNVISGKCMELDSNNGATHRDGDNIRQWECQPNLRHQQWEILPSGQIRSAVSGKCVELDSNNGATYRNGANIRQWTCQGNDWQKWEIIPYR